MTETTEGPWKILMRVPLMRIDGKVYREAKPVQSMHGACNQCAFATEAKSCHKAIAVSPIIFGGDCENRDVIYEEVTNS